MADFLQAYIIPKKWEGNEVYAILNNDRGKETYAGISRVYNPTWSGWIIIDREKSKYQGGRIPNGTRINNATLSNYVQQYYRSLFVNKAKGDKIVSQQMANLVFDMAVNHGKGPQLVNEAIKNAGGDIKISNTITTDTLNFLNSIPAKIYPFILARREAYYRSLDDFPFFGNGWLNRLNSFPKVLTDIGEGARYGANADAAASAILPLADPEKKNS